MGGFHVYLLLQAAITHCPSREDNTIPKPVSVAGTQITSTQREPMLIMAVITFPYLCWKGSSIVMQFLFLSGSTKTKPPLKKDLKHH